MGKDAAHSANIRDAKARIVMRLNLLSLRARPGRDAPVFLLNYKIKQRVSLEAKSPRMCALERKLTHGQRQVDFAHLSQRLGHEMHAVIRVVLRRQGRIHNQSLIDRALLGR